MVATTPLSWPSSSNICVVRITTSRSHAVVGVQPDRAVGRGGAWFSPTSTPQPGSQQSHLKISWQCFPSISSADMPKSFSADRLTPVMTWSVIQDQGVGKLVEHSFEHIRRAATLESVWTLAATPQRPKVVAQHPPAGS